MEKSKKIKIFFILVVFIVLGFVLSGKNSVSFANVDCGLRMREAGGTVNIACEPAGTLTSPLRIRRGATTFGILLVDITDALASRVRIRTSTGIMALKRLLAPPAAPSGLSATAVSASQINLSWTDNSGDETGFQIERCTGAGCTGFGLVHTTAANATSWSDTGLVHSTLYRYRVRAINAVGNSSYSNIAEATTPPEGEYLLYVTAASFTGNLGGRSGADTRCNTDSNKPTACVSAGWALISVSETDEIQDMPTTRGVNTSFAWRWARGAARCVAATSWADLLDGTIANAATCVNYASSWIWTGSTFRGAVVGGNVCAGWIIGDTSARGQEGHTTSNDGGWLDVGNWNCSWQSPLYCACKAAI